MNSWRHGVARVLSRWLSAPQPAGRRQRLLIAGACLGGVLLIGLLDVSTGADLTLGAFYFLPIAACTIALGLGPGLSLIGATAVVSLSADFIRRSSRPPAVHVINGTLRSITLLIAVTLLANLRVALDRARASEKTSLDFLSYAAHQLRTPVAGARTAAEALMLEGVPESQEELLRRIASETARSGRLVASLLQVARLDQGEPNAPRDCDIREVVAEEVERVQNRVPSVDVTVFVQPWVPQRVRLSPEDTRETLHNLLDNARKHAKQTITVSVEATDTELEVRVRDDGGGVPASEAARVFERFVTLDGLGGSGLGLPIARGLTERQGGQLHLDDDAFVMRLPLRA